MKGKCPECKKSIKVENGFLIYHEVTKRIKKSVSSKGCPGSYMKPKE